MARYEDERYWKRRPRASAPVDSGTAPQEISDSGNPDDKAWWSDLGDWLRFEANPFFTYRSTEAKNQMLREEEFERMGIPKNYKPEGPLTIGPRDWNAPAPTQPLQYSQGVGELENQSPAERGIIDVGSMIVPGGAVRYPISAVGKQALKGTSKLLGEEAAQKVGKVAGKVLDYTVGKEGDDTLGLALPKNLFKEAKKVAPEVARSEKGGWGDLSEEDIRIVNSTSRNTGAVGAKAITPKYVEDTARRSESILDYGAGKQAAHTKGLREKGFNVTAYDIGQNVDPSIHRMDALNSQYDTVFASNVLNVAPSEDFLRRTLAEIKQSVGPNGRAVFNYPESPRKSGLDPVRVEAIIKEYFPETKIVNGNKRSPLWEARTAPAVSRTNIYRPTSEQMDISMMPGERRPVRNLQRSGMPEEPNQELVDDFLKTAEETKQVTGEPWKKSKTEQYKTRESTVAKREEDIRKANPDMPFWQVRELAAKQANAGQLGAPTNPAAGKFTSKQIEQIKNEAARKVKDSRVLLGVLQTIDRAIDPNGHPSQADINRLKLSLPSFAKEVEGALKTKSGAQPTGMTGGWNVGDLGGPAETPVVQQATMGGMGLPKAQNVYPITQMESKLLKEYPGLSYEDASRIARSQVSDVERDAILAAAKPSGPPVTQYQAPTTGFSGFSQQANFFDKPSTLTGVLDTRTPYQKAIGGAKLGQIPGRYDKFIDYVRDFFGTEYANSTKLKLAEVAGKPARTGPAKMTGKQLTMKILDATFGLQKSIQAAWDLSIPGRQAIIALPSHPKAWVQSWGPMLRSAAQETFTLAQEAKLKADPDYINFVLKYGHPPSVKKGADFTQSVDSFASKFAEKYLGVRPSQRASSTYLDQIMYRQWKSALPQMKKLGATEADYKLFGKLVDTSLGQGQLPKWISKDYGRVINMLLFSPKLLWSRVVWPYYVAKGIANPVVRKEAVKQAVGMLAFGAGVVGIYKVAGGDVELDPRSSVWGKLKVGDTYYDIWGGYAPIVRTLAQGTTGTKKTVSGELQDIDRKDAIARFAQSKGGSMTNLIRDLWVGEDFEGYPMEWTPESVGRNVVNRLAPLSALDIADGFNDSGVLGMAQAAPSLVGVGVTTFVDPVSMMKNTYAEELTKNEPEGPRKWADLTGNEQARLLLDNPELKEANDADYERYAQSRAGKDNLRTQYTELYKKFQLAFDEEIKLADAEYEATKDGVKFRERVMAAESAKRNFFNVVEQEPKFAGVIAKFGLPLTPTQEKNMRPEDVLEVKYQQLINGSDMEDEMGNYKFSEAEKRREAFLQQYGQAAIDYVEEATELRIAHQPQRYKELKAAQDALLPYWKVEEEWLAKVDDDTVKAYATLRVVEDKTDKESKITERLILRKYPKVLLLRERIALQRKALLRSRPDLAELYNKYYR